uniref:Uncharacterized protein n=1 Tax=Amorphochlora amoebiformis TaxID=1561963 RepID=A0A7S0CMQ3_9EUKA|mmetsp:Transcript_10219/g.16120  ORF Transcript_10219/g.16120 Transcript_10219/m.16120 type:complete len:309 (+) Transcript_10219:256-1182(+)
MWKLLNNFASSLDKLAQAMPTTRIANLGFQSRLRYTCRNYLDKLSQIQPIHAQEGGSIRASKIEEQLQILKAENKEKDHVIAHLEQKMKEQTLVQTPYTPSTGSYPSSFPGLKSKHLKLDDKTEGVKGRGREGVPNSVGEGMIRVDEVKEMEERYSKQVKLLGQSLHEMSGLYRQEKKRNSEQAETIHILRQQLEVARATNRKLTKEFAYQMRRATQISDTDNTPVRHAHALAEALASPAPRGVFLDDIVEDKNLKVFSSQDKTPITFSSKSPKDDQRRGTDEVRRKPPPPPPPNARGIKLKTRTVKT